MPFPSPLQSVHSETDPIALLSIDDDLSHIESCSKGILNNSRSSLVGSDPVSNSSILVNESLSLSLYPFATKGSKPYFISQPSKIPSLSVSFFVGSVEF